MTLTNEPPNWRRMGARGAGLLFLGLLTALTAMLAAAPERSEAAKVYYCDHFLPGGEWCSGKFDDYPYTRSIPKRAYWLQVGCYPKSPSYDCRSSDYATCIDYGGSEMRIVVQAITDSLQQRYSASGCNLAGWYHPENTVNVLPLVTHLYSPNGSPAQTFIKGWACYGGQPYQLIC